MKPIKTDSDTGDTLRTTPSMRKKGKLASRFIINILKCFKICCPKDNVRKNAK